jgi:hypothetical protein
VLGEARGRPYSEGVPEIARALESDLAEQPAVRLAGLRRAARARGVLEPVLASLVPAVLEESDAFRGISLKGSDLLDGSPAACEANDLRAADDAPVGRAHGAVERFALPAVDEDTDGGLGHGAPPVLPD